eukprot:25303-Eustigmatos_ZCMA.PRE.1
MSGETSVQAVRCCGDEYIGRGGGLSNDDFMRQWPKCPYHCQRRALATGTADGMEDAREQDDCQGSVRRTH